MNANERSNGRDDDRMIEQMFKKLQQTGEMTVDGILCEFVDKANAGEPIDKEALLNRVPSEMKEELAVELGFAKGMLTLGKTYRDAKKASAVES